MARTQSTARNVAANLPAVITVAQWQAAQEALAALQAQVAAMQEAQGFDNDDALDGDFTVVAADDGDEFADDEDTAVTAEDESDNLDVGYYFSQDDTSAVYIAEDGYGYAVIATGKHAGKIENDPSEVDMDVHSEFAGELDLTDARARLLAANEPAPPRPTSRRRQAEVTEAAAPAKKTVSDLSPDELRERIGKAGGDSAKIVAPFTGKARTQAMQTWLSTFIKTKRANPEDLTAAKRAATKAVSALQAGRSMG